MILLGLSVLAVAVMAPDLPVPVEVTHVGQPCRARQVLAGRVVIDRTTGRELFVLTNMNETTGMELVFIDFRQGNARVVKAPAGSGSWALREVAGNRLVVGTYYDGVFMVFDLDAMEFVNVADFPGESYVWNLALGKDGRVYGGTYPGGKLGALDLGALTVEDCGAPAPPNLYLRNVSALPDGRILCSFGMETPTTLIYDPATKAFTPPPPPLEGVSVGVSWNGYFLAGGAVYQGQTLDRVDPPPFPTPDGGNWSVDTYVTTDTLLVLQQGDAIFTYAKDDAKLTRVCDFALRGGRPLATTHEGEILGVRGQDYFVIKPGDTELDLRRIPGESGPRPTLFLKADAEGRLWGGPHFGQTLFCLNAGTGETVNPGAVCDGGGEVYDVTFLGGKVYAAAYAGGDIVEYDPKQPWDQWNLKNPRPVTQLNVRGYIRPTGGIAVGPDDRLYSGWMARYGVYGGAVAITDAAGGDTEVIENPLGEQAVTGLAVGDGYVYVGTCLSANGLPQKENESARFGMIELATKEVAFKEVFDGAKSVDRVAYDPKHRRVVMAVDGTPRLFDVEQREMRPALSPPPPNVTSRGVVIKDDGTCVYGNEKSLIQLDVDGGTWLTLAELPASIDAITSDRQGNTFVSCGPDVYRVAGRRP